MVISNQDYIDHELSTSLDSADSFEGPEKLLEIWLTPHENDLNVENGLRSVPLFEWQNLLDIINCKILSLKKSENLDAYILSESSLFVYNNRIILKTCGTTTTLLSIDYFFKICEKYLHWNIKFFKKPFKIFYSRRKFMFPHKQIGLHKDWNLEVQYLDSFFEDGSSYIVGKSNKDHWHLYTNGNSNLVQFPINNGLPSPSVFKFNDETFEILMTGLSTEASRQFFTNEIFKNNLSGNSNLHTDGHILGLKTSKFTQLNNIYNTDAIIHDAFSFTPCGYSSNSIIDEKYYYTLHVTPEKGWSYASFESNVPSLKYNLTNLTILKKILNLFKPSHFAFTLFQLKDEFVHIDHLYDFNNHEKTDRIIYDVDEYELLYLSFVIGEE
ncbi:adenosylmethionine decarboxylase SPE2 [Ascoidea rubescens DSM 1968]|uniref:S-adenosylmethionine decarboxylase proenzyme n=1 Tax=Ascoidea rubescens DSM 1968 TaxID=1344418 RepID=A0A1D2VKS9_9ASCO|nr:S-adenosylmethionine decarboxylase [Ascoidea rubescens DSM 1968]ODV62195.1 S-adenosylmethionine decarboxylase [Ascoidea rubescens DSM 1968]